MKTQEKRKRRQVQKDYEKFKKIARRYVQKGNLEYACRTIYFACGFMFHMNQIFYDDEMEQLLEHIVKKMHLQKIKMQIRPHSCLFYDSFGRADRGLVSIYLKALAQIGWQVLYVTKQEYSAVQKDVLPYVNKEQIRFVTGGTFLEQIRSLAAITEKFCPQIIMMYLMPEDITAVGAFSFFKGQSVRYQINLTDHAFWIGKNVSDRVINFRAFGARTCMAYRGIGSEKNAFLPYYPKQTEALFAGFGLAKQKKPVIFSGGNLYKTQSRDYRYYRLVKQILEKYDVSFVYFGNGDAAKMRALCRKYPDRVRYFRERADYFEAMKRSVCCLSTYPYAGGLMTQYALLAGKVPVTLRADGMEEELTLNPEQAFWNFDTEEACIQEIGKLLKDETYRKKQQQRLSSFYIGEQQFAKELRYLLDYGRSIRKVIGSKPEIRGLREQPLWYYRGLRYNRLFFRRKGFFLIRYFPFRYLTGAAGRMLEIWNNGK